MFLAPVMHSRVGRFRQALAMHMSLASVMHSRVGRFRQALAMHMSLAPVMHSLVGHSKLPNINCRGVWRLVSRHPLSAKNSLYIYVCICTHTCTYIYARGHAPFTRTCPSPSLPFIELWDAIFGAMTNGATGYRNTTMFVGSANSRQLNCLYCTPKKIPYRRIPKCSTLSKNLKYGDFFLGRIVRHTWRTRISKPL